MRQSIPSTLAFALLIGAQFLAAIVLISKRKAIYGEPEDPSSGRCEADAASEGCAVPRSWGASVPSEPTESPLELAQIRYFVTLCGERNFTRGARRCGVSQPSLSNGIKALECELGGKLFERSHMSLTPLGKRLRLHFECAVASAGQITKRAKAFHRRQLTRRRGAVVQSQPLLDPAGPLCGAQCFEEATQRPLSGLAGQAEPDAAASSLRIS